MAAPKLCGAKKKRGGTCELAAGWGTDHLGYGRCRFHFGSSPNGRKGAAREELGEFMAAAAPLLEVDPIQALLYCVQRAAMVANYVRRRVALVEEGEELQEGQLNVWSRLEAEWLGYLARWSKMALDAGVAERQLRMAEQAGDLIAQALEAELQAVDLPDETVARLVRGFSHRLEVLELEPAAGGAGG